MAVMYQNCGPNPKKAPTAKSFTLTFRKQIEPFPLIIPNRTHTNLTDDKNDL